MGKPSFASSVEGLSYPASNATDGDSTTRWSSGQWMQSGSIGWIYVDLGSPQAIGEVQLNWETAYAADYQIQASNDAQGWTTLVTVNGNQASGLHESNGLAETARYVRIYCTSPAPTTTTTRSTTSTSTPRRSPTWPRASRPPLPRSRVPAIRRPTPPTATPRPDGPAASGCSRAPPAGSTFDLGASKSFGEVQLNWETAYGVAYQIQTSNDALTWTTLVTVTGNATAGVHDYSGFSANARYVRVYATQTSAANDNYSLYSLSVYA